MSRDSITENQHYVPAFLLRKFGFGTKSKRRVYVWDVRQKSNLGPRLVKEVASESWFYDHDNTNENLLKLLEDAAGKVVAKLVETSSFRGLTVKEIDVLVEFISTLLVRTKKVRERISEDLSVIRNTYERLQGKVSEGVKTLDEDGLKLDHDLLVDMPKELELYPEIREALEQAQKEGTFKPFLKSKVATAYFSVIEIEEEARVGHIEKMNMTIASVAEDLPYFRWKLVKNHFDTSFWISDHPVVVFYQDRKRSRSKVGVSRAYYKERDDFFEYFNLIIEPPLRFQKLLHSPCIILVPLSHDLCLMLFDPKDDVTHIRFENTGAVRDSQWVHYSNQLQVARANRFVFSKDENFDGMSGIQKGFEDLRRRAKRAVNRHGDLRKIAHDLDLPVW